MTYVHLQCPCNLPSDNVIQATHLGPEFPIFANFLVNFWLQFSKFPNFLQNFSKEFPTKVNIYYFWVVMNFYIHTKNQSDLINTY